MTDQPIELSLFFSAQAKNASKIITELTQGQKKSDWMDFTFPQIAGSVTERASSIYAIQSIQHAHLYMNHSGLANRLRFNAKLILRNPEKDIERLLNPIDTTKLHASMTLFSLISPQDTIFQHILSDFFDSKKNIRTLQILEQQLKNRN